MIVNDKTYIAMRCSISTVLSALCLNFTAAAQDALLRFDEIIVTSKSVTLDPTLIAPDAASLIATPGDVNDPLKALLSLPGITFGGSDLDSPIIRGGGLGDNLFLIDGVPVENVFHELSDSIVSPNVIRTFDLEAAAYSPEYGGATGGVIDIGLRDPSATERRINIDLSQLKSGFLVETPITENVSVYGAYRHNLAHLFLEEFERGNDALVFKMPESRDYTGRAIWRGSDTDITLTAFGSWDKTEEVARDPSLSDLFGIEETRQLDAQSIRIRSALSDMTDVSATFSHSKVNEDRREADGSFSERDATVFSFRGKMTHESGRHHFKLGVNHTSAENSLAFRGFLPLCDRLEQNCGGAFSNEPTTNDETYQSTEFFLGDTISLTERLTIDLGLHTAVNHFLDEHFIEPRLGISYSPRNDLDLYARFGRHNTSPDPGQLLTLNSIADVQKSEQSSHALLGGRWNIADGWRLQTEAWYKDFEHTELVATPLERKLDGQAFGVDLLLAKPISERLYGWIALSLSDSEIVDNASGLNVTNQYVPPVSATVAASYAFDNNWKVGLKYRAQSGDPYTPLKSVIVDPVTGVPAPTFGAPFSERLDTYHRLDVRLEKAAEYSFGDVTYYVDILNVTDNKNLANREFPLRNTQFIPNDIGSGDTNSALIIPDDDEGIPLFVAFGVNFSF